MLISQTIHAGDTPLASTLAVEQTGPMQLTVRAGRLVTTGEARILPAATVATPDALVAAGLAEWLPDGQRLRVWLQNVQGVPLLKSATYTLSADVVFPLTSDPTSDKSYLLEFGTLNGTPDVLCRSQLAGEAQPAAPAGWQTIQWLSQFTVPAGTTTLDAITIPVFTVLPGFPAGTSAADWLVQRGVA